ncbi:sensor domain-containing phosphodiesterase [Solwaraspora sp. WMMD406]|uniref:putative bifunctional diguanylate cyclase/phosphodiesterase n=1 Tax=Solwaraspora sp. WMMD406 TaxID=3016095 RepID=UPI00241765DB|nr:sensor domain-containing phosphodiesterase [Solwaraspora sp. WMMD406]MDG4763644.1 sensor domain-containing phosphodiesterase [Solwaraspora sp. WMMD406]
MPRSQTIGRHSQERGWFVTAPLALLGVLISVALGISHPNPIGDWWTGFLFFGLFLAANSALLIFEVRRQAFSLSIGEIPFLLGLFFLPPLTLIICRVLAAAVVHLGRFQSAAQLGRQSAPVKLWFNIANIAAGTSVASAIVASVGVLDAADPQTWLALVGAMVANLLITLVSVLLAITLVQGRLSPKELTTTTVPGLVVALINITFGLVVLILLAQSRWALILLAALVTFFVLAYRAYAQSMRQHRTLSEIYDLTRAIADTPHDGTITDILLKRVREMLQAEYATLWLPKQGRYPEVLLSARADDRGLVDTTGAPHEIRERVLETGSTLAVGTKFGDGPFTTQLREWGTKDAIVVPLRAGSLVIGCLEVSGRLGDFHHFVPGDIRLLEAIAVHAAVAVENSRLVDRLRYDAAHDGLTGLANRRRLATALDESVAIRTPGEVVAVLLFDVDGLRQVNESLGHAAGDKVLAEVARRLRASAPSAALVGRSGGDEFVVTLRAESVDLALALARELRQQIRDKMVFGALTLDVDTVVGVAVHPDHGSDAATLLQRADLAASAAKTVSDSVQMFNPALESRSVRRLGLAGDLRTALENGQLEVYYQPKVTLTGRRLVGVECLTRWEHPTHGSVSPEDFVAVAEHTGQLGRLTEFVLREGLRRCREWTVGQQPLPVAVNLSARTLSDPDFPDLVRELLDDHQVAPQLLTLEIAEAGVLDGTDRPMPTLRRLRDLGVRLSVDDFGTGYTSLAHLRRLPVHEVKVDRSFVQGMATDPGDLAIVNAIVTLSQQFGLTVVAEGVESELTLELLQDIGCQIGQGFLFSRPLPYERLAAWYEAQADPEVVQPSEVRRLRAVP